MKNFQQTGFARRILRKMTNRHSYYNKEIPWIRQLFQTKDIARESVNLRTIDIFTDMFFLKYVTKMFYISYYFQEKHLEVF